MEQSNEQRALAAGARRAIFYLFYDPRGIVDDYIPYKLERLRPHADHITVIVNGALDEAGRVALEAVSDDVWQRENIGFDVEGYKDAIERFGERASEFDELLLMNYTFFGPIGDFAPLFERMDAANVDFWGMTDHTEVTPNPITLDGTMPRHLQSHWIAVRRPVFESEAWRDYWRQMPPIRSYSDSILNHESRFTSHFESLGFVSAAAYPHENYPGTPHPAFERAQQLLEDGCPVLKRRPFFHDPLYLDREGVIGRYLLDEVEQRGYPVEFVLRNMSRTSMPRVLNTAASLLEILPDQQVGYDPEKPFRILAAVHIFYEDLTDELLDRLESLPNSYDLVATTTDEAKAEYIRERIAARSDARLAASEVRVLPSNRGRDLSAFFVATRDKLVSDEYDLVVKVHSKKTVQQGAAVGTLFKRQQLDNLLGTPGYTANVIGLFQKEPTLGAVYPPTVHIGFPTMGGAWFTNKEPTKKLADRLGIRVPLDDLSPLAPLGAMWIARPEAMRLLFEIEYDYTDYSPETDHSDGSLAHVQERIIPYAAGELGYHVKTVANTEYAAISHTFLEYKLDQLSRTVQGYAIEEVGVLQQWAATVSRVDSGVLGTIRAYFGRHHPGLRDRLSPAYHGLRKVLGRAPANPEQ
ncbi:lipopolysaccharide biosynthesis protein [Microbacteriaceae bacterium SG_E_30_P1]|uniref:Lipopolysaccharide biosynthesis protein n=1 Tax=Antiquaquibacter oligotrophicus TaxID=2880260 RepID=A0ABT6KPX3_9MICO|nr:rhamnan synthesis F family protein [Antiquaquibacter oligotrophicus]MDH6182041.1 lipopolysaccharide biosynthesis protein [Antiquaquibacter oligotrophicus]UDF12291.1 rhamnan synthesis F family protein [Antiquaquibacter oligotrophicus]